MNKKKASEGENFLLYIPKKKHINYKEIKGRIVLYFGHNKIVEKLARLIVKKPKTTDIELDELSSEVWRLIDGKNTIYEIMEKMKIKFGSRCEPLNERLILFMRYLNKKNWISFNKEKAKTKSKAS